MYKEKLNKLMGRRSWIKDQLEEKKSYYDQLEREKETIEKVQVFIQETAKETQEGLKYCIEDIVQSALDAVFPGEYEFETKFEIKRGRTEAKLSFLKHDEEINPMEASGGGVVDIVSFALRLAVWSLGKTAPFIVLDEPMKFLSKDKIDLAGQILQELSKKLGLQILIITHINQLTEYSNRVYQVEMRENKRYQKSFMKLLSDDINEIK